jgi:hypothetical protein
MPEENVEIESTIEDENVPEVETQEELKSEEEESPKEDFEKDSESVPAGKYNQAIRKQREIELEKRELEKKLAEVSGKVPVEKDEEDDFFKEDIEEKVNISSLIDEKVKPVLERLNQREAEEKKNQRTAFFQAHPEYLADPEKWQELLDEMDASLNPNSKDDYYKQLTKAHRIISAEVDYTDIDKKKKDMASDSASKGDGAQKAADTKSSVEDRADRLAQKMPIGYSFTGK